MKSKSLKVFVKGMIVAGAAFALAACDDNVNSPVSADSPTADQQVQEGQEQEEQGLGGQEQGELNQEQNGNNEVPGEQLDTESSGLENAEVVGSSSSEAAGQEGGSNDVVGVESGSSEAVEEGGIFLANDTDEDQSYMEIEYRENTGWDGGGILAYPKRLSDTKKHAVIVWGPGGGTEPGAYGGMIRRLASHGFVVIALKESPGNGTQATNALDWMEEQNSNPQSPLFGKLDMTKVGCSGHSMGGLESEWMVANDDRVITSILNNSGYMSDFYFPLTPMTSVPTSKTIAIVYGEGGMERPNAEGDYNNPNVKAPACLLKMTGGQGTECQQGECGYGHGSGAWSGIAATVAWMRWHLGGEDWRKDDFVGTTGKYIDGPIIGQLGKWKGQCKNF